MVKTTVDTLVELKNNNGETVEKCYKQITDGKFSDVKLVDLHNHRKAFQKSSVQYLDNLINNISNRFDHGSMSKLHLLDMLLILNFFPYQTMLWAIIVLMNWVKF